MGLRLLFRWSGLAVLAAAAFPASALGASVSVTGGVVTVRDTAGVVNLIAVEPWFHDSDGILITESAALRL